MTQIYDDRYLRGIALFNEHKFYECHDLLEELWIETTDESKSFYQGLIQAAVSLYHLSRQNWTGARTLYYSAVGRLEKYLPKYQGLDIEKFLSQLHECLISLLENQNEETCTGLDPKLIPHIELK